MYSPTLGRFLQADPSGTGGSGTNLYAYVGNDPMNNVDPTGKCFGPFIIVCYYAGEEAIGFAVAVISAETAEGGVAVAGGVALETSAAAPALTATAEFGGTSMTVLAAENPLLVSSVARVEIAAPLSWDAATMSVPEISPELARKLSCRILERRQW